MPRFVTRRDEEPTAESPEALFRALRPVNGAVSYLWSHQADMLRAFQVIAPQQADVAIELPTGSGKTLVGLLIGEWRRRIAQERVAYLCPTVHLARQVGERAAEYGIPAVVLTGRSAEWEQSEFLAYSRSQAVAVSTYSALFNTNPRLNDPQTLLFDDAHSGEDPVASMWSLKASRGEPLFRALLDIVGDDFPEAHAQRLVEDSVDPRDQHYTEMLGPHQLAPKADLLREALDTYAEGSAAFTRSIIESRVGSCLLFASWRELLIRPLIPPTRFHAPFASASRRVYMSATPGAGGELERAFGVTSITRLPVPPGWQEHGSGRRFFLFPGASLTPSDADAFITQSMAKARRSLVLTPSQYEAEQFGEVLPAGMPVLTAHDLEFDPGVMTRHVDVAAVVANRYDGIDLPDDACRLIVLTGLPSGGHLQERFLYERLGAKRVLAERIRTRLTQGAGRCTRNANDYAAVIVRGARLIDFLSRAENVQPMQPDIQAEIEFGFDNSDVTDVDLVGLLDSFLEQDAEWRPADADIRARATAKRQEPQPGANELATSARYEVESWQAAWRGDLSQASEVARRAADNLAGPTVAPYRCLWLYLAASFSLSDARTPEQEAHARVLADDAEACARTLAWRPRFGLHEADREFPTEFNARDERAARVLGELGLRGLRFERRLEEVGRFLENLRADPFAKGLRALGELLGFEAVRPGGSGAPDCAWRDGDAAWIVFEAKTEVADATPIAMRDVRQALTHRDWLESTHGWSRADYALTCLVTAQRTINTEAAGIARDLMVLMPSDLQQVAKDAFAALRAVRSRAPALDDDEIAAAIANQFRTMGLDTDGLALRLAQKPAARMRVDG